MAGIHRREEIQEKCEKCNGTGAPFVIPGDPTSGNDLSKTCDACDGKGYLSTIKES
jgi:DnaJ-class molecular chaperone